MILMLMGLGKMPGYLKHLPQNKLEGNLAEDVESHSSLVTRQQRTSHQPDSLEVIQIRYIRKKKQTLKPGSIKINHATLAKGLLSIPSISIKHYFLHCDKMLTKLMQWFSQNKKVVAVSKICVFITS